MNYHQVSDQGLERNLAWCKSKHSGSGGSMWMNKSHWNFGLLLDDQTKNSIVERH